MSAEEAGGVRSFEGLHCIDRREATSTHRKGLFVSTDSRGAKVCVYRCEWRAREEERANRGENGGGLGNCEGQFGVISQVDEEFCKQTCAASIHLPLSLLHRVLHS